MVIVPTSTTTFLTRMALPARIDRKSHRQDANKRSPAHRSWVRGHMCCVPGCEAVPIECAHVRNGTGGGMSVKPSDRWCISLCRDHHDMQHRFGEQTFAKSYGLNLKALAEEFARKSPHAAKLREMV